jgi:hypothetical protein
MWEVWKSGVMWRSAEEEVAGGCGDGARVHNGSGVCTGACGCVVEEVGKDGRVAGVEGEFCNCPETAG